MTTKQMQTVEWLQRGRDFSNLKDVLFWDVVDMGEHMLVRLDYELNLFGAMAGCVGRLCEIIAVNPEGGQKEISRIGWRTNTATGEVSNMDYYDMFPVCEWSE